MIDEITFSALQWVGFAVVTAAYLVFIWKLEHITGDGHATE